MDGAGGLGLAAKIAGLWPEGWGDARLGGVGDGDDPGTRPYEGQEPAPPGEGWDVGDTEGEIYPRESAIPLSSLPENATGRRVAVPGAPADEVFVDYGPGNPGQVAGLSGYRPPGGSSRWGP